MSKSLLLAAFSIACLAAAFWPASERERDQAAHQAGRREVIRACSRAVWGTDSPPRPGLDVPVAEVARDLELWFDQWSRFQECLANKGYQLP